MIKDLKLIIDNYIKLERQYRKDIVLILVANVEGKTTEYDDYDNTSVLSEYYTLDEFETISTIYKKLGYEVFSFFSEKDFMSAILNNRINCKKQKLVINSAQTGTYVGRKSLIPAFCECFKIMHTGSNPYVVSLCRDKFHTNSIINPFVSHHLNVYLFDKKEKWINKLKPKLGEKIILKLNNESASIGLTRDNIINYDGEESDSFIQKLAEKYNQSIVAQQFITGYEVELPIIALNTNRSLIPVGISYQESPLIGDYILDYSARFNHLYEFYNYINYNPEIALQLQKEALQITTILGMEGFCRIDFRIDINGQHYVSDIATNPHITEDSSFAYTFNEMGYSYQDMFSCLVGCTLLKYHKSLQ